MPLIRLTRQDFLTRHECSQPFETGRGKKPHGGHLDAAQALSVNTGHHWVTAAISLSPFLTSSKAFQHCSTPQMLISPPFHFHSNRVCNQWRTQSYPPERCARSPHRGSMCGLADWSPAPLLMWITWAETLSMRGDTSKQCKLWMTSVSQTVE